MELDMIIHQIKERQAIDMHLNNAIALQKWGSYLKTLEEAKRIVERVKKELWYNSSMKANKCEVVSRRTRSITRGSYAPSFNERPEKRKYNPYDKPTNSLPQYNGRISW